MKINLDEAVKNYECSSYIDVLKEAVINSIQSNSTDIQINIKAKKDLENNNFYVSDIEILDDGDGFNEKNIESFSTLYTDYKEKDGCKGVGRLSYLKLFKDVNIESYIKENDECKSIELEFTTNFNSEKDFKIKKIETEKYEKINNKKNQTIIKLDDLKKDEKYDENDIFEKIKEHIIYYLIINDKLHISINSKEIEKEKDISHKTFNVDGIKEEFILYYKIEETKDNTSSTKDFIIIDSKSIETFKDIFRINIGERKDYKMLFLLKSKFFDNNSNMMHKLDAKLEDKESEDKESFSQFEIRFDDNLSKKELKEKLKRIKKQLIEELKGVIGEDKIKDYNKKILNDIREKDEILHYINFIDLEKEKYFFFNDETVYKYAKGEYNKLETSIINNKEVTDDELKKYINTNLNAYIIYRQRIIEKLKEIFEKENEHTKEKVIHNLFLEQKTENLELDLSNNNLWILDDKFMTFDSYYSDEELKNIFEKSQNSFNMDSCRPDILMFKNKKNDETKVVILEFKRSEANNYDYVKGAEQLENYANYIALEKVKCKEFYCYLFINSDALKKDNYNNTIQTYINRNYVPIYTSSDEVVYCRKVSLVAPGRDGKIIGTANVFIVTYNAIIEDAFSRNKTFIDIIKNQDILKNIFRDYDNIKNE